MGTLINHSERRLKIADVEATIVRACKLGLSSKNGVNDVLSDQPRHMVDVVQSVYPH